MVTDPNVPSLAIARAAYGEADVVTIISAYVYQLVIAMGVNATTQACDLVAEDIMGGYPDLKITEVMLALKMMREGKFRDGTNNEHDAGKMFGVLSSEAICNCLYRYRCEYRNPILQRREEEERRRKRDEEFSRSESPQVHALRTLKVDRNVLQLFLSEKQMNELQYYVDERKMHLLLRQRVSEYLEGKADKAALQKAIEYLNTHFPVSNGNNADTQ